MLNKSTDTLFQLLKSLTKAEKKNFKLFVTRNSNKDALKTVLLFDILDKMDEYNEPLIYEKIKDLPRQQLSNLKGRLYREILSSLRLIKSEGNIDIQLHEQMDHARILYNKGLYLHSLKILEQIKTLARAHNQLSYLQQALFFEKKIEALHITRSLRGRADELAAEANEVNQRITTVSRLSDLSLQLYSWYINNGHARNKEDEQAVKEFFEQHILYNQQATAGFYEQLYACQSYCWYCFIQQDFFKHYHYSFKWVTLFEQSPGMTATETMYYIKGMHNLLSAHFYLLNYRKFNETLAQFEDFSKSDIIQNNENYLVQTFVYLHISILNKHFLEGTFTEGLNLIPFIEDKLIAYAPYIDRHRILIFYYKIACLYFGSGAYELCIDYLDKIINLKVTLRNDLQCYARLLHLIAHYELGDLELLEYLSRSAYRFMSKMDNLSVVEEEVFNFLRLSIRITPKKIEKEFPLLLARLEQNTGNRFETRAFAYLDIISWLKSKISKVAVQDIIHDKYLATKKHK